MLVAFEGDLDSPRTFSFAELQGLPLQVLERSRRTAGRTLRGVRLGGLAERLGVKSWARFAIVRGADGYAANIPVRALGECMLAFAADEEPLAAALGGPLRLLARSLGRCANVKRVTSVVFAIEPAAIERACAHERARARGLLALAGGRP